MGHGDSFWLSQRIVQRASCPSPGDGLESQGKETRAKMFAIFAFTVNLMFLSVKVLHARPRQSASVALPPPEVHEAQMLRSPTTAAAARAGRRAEASPSFPRQPRSPPLTGTWPKVFLSPPQPSPAPAPRWKEKMRDLHSSPPQGTGELRGEGWARGAGYRPANPGAPVLGGEEGSQRFPAALGCKQPLPCWGTQGSSWRRLSALC